MQTSLIREPKAMSQEHATDPRDSGAKLKRKHLAWHKP